MPGDNSLKRIKSELEKTRRDADKIKKQLEALRRKEERQSLQLDLFHEVGVMASRGVRIQEFLEKLMDRLMAYSEAGSGSLLLLSEDEQWLEFRVVRGPGSQKLKGKRIPAGEGIAGKVLKTGAPYFTPDAMKDPLWNASVGSEAGIKTRDILAVPLKIAGHTRGAIELINRKDARPFDRDDIDLIRTLASEAAMGIENARLITEAKEQAQQFGSLYRVSSILNSSLNPKAVRKAAMEAAVKLLDCETGSLYLIDEEKGELFFEVALGEKGEAVKEIRLKIGEGIAGWVAQEGKSDLVPDTTLDPRWASRVDKKSKFQTRNMVTVPVRARGKVIGVLQALNKLGDRKFDVQDQRMLENLADQVAIALENARLYDEQKQMFIETAQALAAAIEKRDPYTGGHTRRVSEFCMATAKYMKLSQEDYEWLELASILHDIGKIGVADGVLNKPDRLNDSEFLQMKSHPAYGHEILQHVKQLARAIPGMKYHHERYDGRGYPEGLADGQIPLQARIISVADTWDAMTSDRPYRRGLPDEVAAAELKKYSGIQFDPEVVEAFLKAWLKGDIHSQHWSEEHTSKKRKTRCKAVDGIKPKGCVD